MKYHLIILPIFIMLILAPALMAAPSNVYAQNEITQSIRQIQSVSQLGICLAGIDTFISCLNANFQTQQNSGSNAAAQQGGSGGKGGSGSGGKGGGNSIDQGIGQSQSSNQNAMCVAGGSIGNSCNNTSTQTQQNSGSNAAAQQGGSGGKGAATI